MTIEQLNYLLRKELYAIKKHKDNIDRIKKEYFDSNYGLKEGDKIRILHETGDEMIGFLKPEWYELYERELEECDRFIWITDACMRDGVIRKVKAKIEEYGGLLLADIPDRITPYEIGRDAFESKEEALKHAEKRRTYLIESTKKQLNELENLKFKCDD
jgi:hypothetical protein